MKISEMMEILQHMKDQYGDLPMTTINTDSIESKPYHIQKDNFGVMAIIDGVDNRFLMMVKR